MSGSNRYYLCVTCGVLKSADCYEADGQCTCNDCLEEDSHSVNFREAPDGEGFVRACENDGGAE